VVEEHSARGIKLSLKFLDPSAVSSTRDGRDIINFKVLDPGQFKSALSGKSMDTSSLDNAGFIKKELPPIVANPLVSGAIAGSAATGTTILNFLSTGNFFVGIILGGSMQQLWGMIRAMQMIILCAVIQVSFPAHTFMFFQACMLFAKMDILSGEDFYNAYFELKETIALNPNFEGYGYDSKSYFLNSGSVFLIQGGLVGFYGTKFVVNKLMGCCAKNKDARKIGIWADEQQWVYKIMQAEMKLFMESYFEITMCSLISLVGFIEASDAEDFAGFFNTPGNCF